MAYDWEQECRAVWIDDLVEPTAVLVEIVPAAGRRDEFRY